MRLKKAGHTIRENNGEKIAGIQIEAEVVNKAIWKFLFRIMR